MKTVLKKVTDIMYVCHANPHNLSALQGFEVFQQHISSFQVICSSACVTC